MPSRKGRNFLTICAILVASMVLGVAALRGLLAPTSIKDRSGVLLGHQYPVLALAFDPDNERLSSAAGFPTNPREEVELIEWNISTAAPVRKSTGFQANLSTLSFSPDGLSLGTAGSTTGVRLWNVGSLRAINCLDANRSGFCCLAVSGNGSYLAAASRENEVMLWDCNGTHQWIRPSGHDRFAQALAFSSDSPMLGSGGSDGRVQLWDVASGKTLLTIAGHSAPVHAVTFAPDGQALATGDRAGTIKIWNVSTGVQTDSMVANEPEPAASTFIEGITCMAYAPDGQTLAVAVGSAVLLWDVSQRAWVAKLAGHDGKVHCLSYSHDGLLLASGAQNGSIRISDVNHLLGRAQ